MALECKGHVYKSYYSAEETFGPKQIFQPPGAIFATLVLIHDSLLNTRITYCPKMATINVSTPIGNLSAEQVLTALHNHDLMIKTLCPALISYHFESGDPKSQATYFVIDKKPIGQVRLSFLLRALLLSFTPYTIQFVSSV